MPVAIAAVAAAAIGGGATLIAGSKAAKAQKKAADTQIAESRRQYDQDRADYAPWRTAGANALDVLTRTYGIGGGTPDMSAFTASPGYQFRRDEGVKAIERSAASRGLLKSGAAVKAIDRFAEGNAASEFGDWWNRTAGIAGAGQAATTAGAQSGMAATSMINNATQQAGNARASSYANTGSAINSGINNVLAAYLYQRGGFGGAAAPPATSPSTPPYYPGY